MSQDDWRLLLTTLEPKLFLCLFDTTLTGREDHTRTFTTRIFAGHYNAQPRASLARRDTICRQYQNLARDPTAVKAVEASA